MEKGRVVVVQEYAHNQRCEKNPCKNDTGRQKSDEGYRCAQKIADSFFAFARFTVFKIALESRDKGHRNCILRKKTAQKVWNHEGNSESVGIF